MTNRILKEKMKITIEVDIAIIKEENYFVAYCPALELSAYADTKEKAKKAFESEVKIFIDETNKRGTLEKYLLKNGWKLQQVPVRSYEPPRHSLNMLNGLIKSNALLIRKNIQLPVK